MAEEVVTLREYLETLRVADHALQDERDHRYSEVKNAEEKALAVKEKADENALILARDIQTYKDQRDNQLREQINSERNLYATQSDLKVVVEKIQAQRGIAASQMIQILIFIAIAAAAVIAWAHK
jgi:hypothetical protein